MVLYILICLTGIGILRMQVIECNLLKGLPDLPSSVEHYRDRNTHDASY